MKVFVSGVLCCIVMMIPCVVLSQNNNHTPNNPFNIDSALLGNFMDDYKIRYTISPTTFTQHPGVKYNIVFYNEKEEYFIAQNDSANVSDAGLFTRIDIMRFTNMEPWRWGFCLTSYQAKTLQAALETTPANRDYPKKGCGGYPFSRMKREN